MSAACSSCLSWQPRPPAQHHHCLSAVADRSNASLVGPALPGTKGGPKEGPLFLKLLCVACLRPAMKGLMHVTFCSSFVCLEGVAKCASLCNNLPRTGSKVCFLPCSNLLRRCKKGLHCLVKSFWKILVALVACIQTL